MKKFGRLRQAVTRGRNFMPLIPFRGLEPGENLIICLFLNCMQPFIRRLILKNGKAVGIENHAEKDVRETVHRDRSG